MKLKVCLFTFIIFQSFTSFAQYDHLFEFVYPIEQKLQSIKPMNLKDFTPKELSEAFSRGGVILSHEGSQKMKQGLTRLEQYIANAGSYGSPFAVQNFFANGGFPISIEEAKAIYSHLNGGPKIGANAHVFFMTLVSAKTKAIFEKLIELAYRPAKPNSPVKQSINRVVERAFTLQTIMLPKTSGVDDWFANAYTAVGARYTSFDDEERYPVSASFYTNSFIHKSGGIFDLTKLATNFDPDGGGHANACGCRIKPIDGKIVTNREVVSEDIESNINEWLNIWSQR